MRVYFLAVLLASNSLYSQQIIVSGSYNFPHQFNLFEKEFVGNIQVISRFSYKDISELDTVNYLSDKSGLFISTDTSKFNLNNMFEGIHFDYNNRSKSFVDKVGRVLKVFDTLYAYGQDSFSERTLFYPNYNLFVLIQSKNKETSCRYMTRQFDEEKSIQKITYYSGLHKNIQKESVLEYLAKARFSEIYEFGYRNANASKRVTVINYYRFDKKIGKKFLYASNSYLYGKSKLVTKALFSQFKGGTKIKGEILFSYYSNTK